jgi:hypothetical protein
MITFSYYQLLPISFFLIAFLTIYISYIFYLLEKGIKKIETNHQIQIYELKNKFEKNYNDLIVKFEEFELNTKKNLDKRFSQTDKNIENLNQLIRGLTSENIEQNNEIGKIREKIKITVGKNKILEEKVENVENAMTTLNPENFLRIEDKTNNLDMKLSDYNNKNLELKEKLILYEENYALIKPMNESVNRLMENIKSTNSKIGSLERKYNNQTTLSQEYVKNSELDKVMFEIDNIKTSVQKISDEITLSEKISDITSDSCSTDTKNYLEEPKEKNIQITEESVNKFNPNDLYKLYNISQKEYYVEKISKLIHDEIVLIETHKNIEKKIKEKYPDRALMVPTGFNILLIGLNGMIEPNPNSLHLLSSNYRTTGKQIEIIFCKNFIKTLESINFNLNINYYVNKEPDSGLELYKFNIPNDIPINMDNDFDSESNYLEMENQCLKGIFYIMIKRKESLERFNFIYKTFV